MEPIYLKITSETSPRHPDTVVVQLSGKLGLPDVARFKGEVQRLLGRGCRHIEIDLSELLYIDSCGVASLVPIYQTVTDNQGTLRLLHPRRIIHHILTTAHIQDIIPIGEVESNLFPPLPK